MRLQFVLLSQHIVQNDKCLAMNRHAVVHCVAGAMNPSLSDTEAGALPAKPSPLPKWSSHFQGERLHGTTYFVLGITFSLPVWFSPMDMAGWLWVETDGGRWLA